jgi:hypothetical protein
LRLSQTVLLQLSNTVLSGWRQATSCFDDRSFSFSLQ